MTNLKITGFLVAILFANCIYSQTYIPFPNDTAVWGIKQVNTSQSGQSTTYLKEIQKGDSTINSVNFNKVYKNSVSNANLVGLYREVNKKIYAKIYPYPDTSQRLIYDFNLNVGDTFYDKYMYLSNPITWKYVVQSISTTSLTTNARKQFDLTLAGGPSFPVPCSTQSWIEGIGSITTLFNAREASSCYFNSLQSMQTYYTLQCFEHNTVQYMQSSCIVLGINTIAENNLFDAFPNPVNDKLFLEYPPVAIGNYEIKLLNSLGKCVKTGPISEEVDIKDLSPSIYFLMIYSGSDLIAIKKIIKQP